MRSVDGVVMEIKRLYGGAHATEATTHLQQWQQSPACSWESITQLIQYPDDLVAFFGANTAVVKAQLGGGCNGEQLLERIVQINGSGASPLTAIRRQLCTAYADLAMYGHASLQIGVQRLSDDALLEMLVAFPEEARNAKVLVSSDIRKKFISQLLSNQAEVFDVISTKENVAKVLSAAEQWLTIPSPSILAARESGARFSSEIFRKKFHEHRVVRLTCENMLTNYAEQATGVLSALLALTNDVTPLTVDTIQMAFEATTALATKLSPPVDPDGWLPFDSSANKDEMTRMLSHISRLLSEWGCLWYRGLGLVPCPEWHTRFGDVALHWMTLRHGDLSKGAIEFWTTVLSVHHHDRKPFEKEIAPWFERLIQKFLTAVRFPQYPEQHEDFNIEMFLHIRDQCAHVITEVAHVLPTQWIITVVGEQVAKHGQWNDLDACLFVLSAVTTRASKGDDAVIPELIRLLPGFSYPTTGIPAVLLRVTAARFLLYTAVYLASEPDALVSSLDFLLTKLLPSLPGIDVDSSLLQYAEALSTDALKVVSFTARYEILSLSTASDGSGEKFWPAFVTQIMCLITNTSFNVDVRCQLCVALGQLLVSLSDLKEMQQSLSAFVQRLEPPQQLTTPANGKTPHELKVYLSAFTSVSSFDPRTIVFDQCHPVLHLWEQNWSKLEEYVALAVQNNYEDWLEQLCMSLTFVFGYSRHVITSNQSPLFVSSLTTLGKAAQAKPHICYYGLLRSTMGTFAPIGDLKLNVVLVDFLGVYAVPVAMQLQNAEFELDVVAHCYDMLGDALRWSNLANGALQSQWLPQVFDPALAVLESNPELATHEKALAAILSFFCSFVRWSTEGPHIVQLSKLLWEGRIPKIVNICVELMRRSSENPTCATVPAIAEVLRPLLNGSMEFETKSCLKQAFMALPAPLTRNAMDAHRLVEVFSMEKVDVLRFGKQVFDTVCDFHGAMKRATECRQE